MTVEQRKAILEKLTQAKKLAFEDTIPNARAVSEIVSQLNSVPQGDKFYHYCPTKIFKGRPF
jgi:hypothetical protein